MPNLFTIGFDTLPMSPEALAAFGPNGPGLSFLSHLPEPSHFTIPLDPTGSWRFIPSFGSQPPPQPGERPDLDFHLQHELAPRARQVAGELIQSLTAALPDRDVGAAGDIRIVKFATGFAQPWHAHKPERLYWDVRVIAAMPFGIAPAPIVWANSAVHTPPAGHFAVITPTTPLRSEPLPSVPWITFSVDLKAPLRAAD